MNAALTVTGLTKRYGRFLAVEEVDLQVAEGAVVGLLGPNGSGKSSILHCTTGIVEPTAGTIEIGGSPHLSLAAKKQLGFVPDDLALPVSLTGAEFLDLTRRLQPATDVALTRELLDLLHLDAAAGKVVAEYSHGMKRKLQIVAALSHRPALLILDEPFRGLDPEAAVVLRALVEAFVGAGGGALVATHDMTTAQTFCDNVYILASGKMVATGTPGELTDQFGRSTLEEVFLAATGIESRAQRVQERIRGMSLTDRESRLLTGERK